MLLIRASLFITVLLLQLSRKKFHSPMFINIFTYTYESMYRFHLSAATNVPAYETSQNR